MTQLSEKPTAIFDLGNVVLDWDVARILGSIGVSETEQFLLRDELFLHQDWVEMDRGAKSETEVAAEVCSRTPLAGETVEKALLAAKTSLDVIPASRILLNELSRYGTEMYCLSNMSAETYEHIKKRDFFSLFSGIVISGIEGCMKPDQAIFELAIERFNLDPEKVLFIDDSLPNIEAAQELGFVGFHFRRSPNCYSEIRNLLL